MKFSRCKNKVSDNMANAILFNRGDNLKMMRSLCQGLSDLVYVCSHDILNECFNFDTIQQINTEMLKNMKPSIENLKVRYIHSYIFKILYKYHLYYEILVN